MAAMIQAALDFAAGRNESAAERLLNASTELRKLDTCMYAAAAQYQLGRLLPGEAGRQHLHVAEQWIRSQNVVRPDRIANLFAPGFAVDDRLN